MKNRRLLITSFLLVATLLIGVGYAATVGQLSVRGSASFRPADAVVNSKEEAIKFSQNDEIQTTKTLTPNNASGLDPITITPAVTSDDEATLYVIVKGVADVSVYEATATFTVLYDTADQSFDPVYVVAQVNEPTNPNFEYEVEILNEDGSSNTEYKLVAGEKIKVKVTVTYTVPNENPDTISVTEDLTVHMNWYDVKAEADAARTGS